MRLICVLTVAPLTTSAAAISPFDKPAAISFRTSTSRDVSWSGSTRVGADCACEHGSHEPLLDHRIEVCSPGGKRSDRLLDLLGARVLRQVAARARLERREQRLVVRVCREDEHLDVGEVGADAAGCFGAVEAWHAQVHEHDIGALTTRVLHCLDAVRRDAHDLDAVDQADEHRQPVAHHPLIVGDQHANHPGTSSSTRQPVSVAPARIVPPARSSRSRIPASP